MAGIEAETWTGESDRMLVIESTEVHDDYVELWIGIDGDGDSVRLSPDASRQIGHSLLVRADLSDDGRGNDEPHANHALDDSDTR